MNSVRSAVKTQFTVEMERLTRIEHAAIIRMNIIKIIPLHFALHLLWRNHDIVQVELRFFSKFFAFLLSSLDELPFRLLEFLPPVRLFEKEFVLALSGKKSTP